MCTFWDRCLRDLENLISVLILVSIHHSLMSHQFDFLRNKSSFNMDGKIILCFGWNPQFQSYIQNLILLQIYKGHKIWLELLFLARVEMCFSPARWEDEATTSLESKSSNTAVSARQVSHCKSTLNRKMVFKSAEITKFERQIIIYFILYDD